MKGKVKNVQEILTSLPSKHYFSIGEVSEACGIKPYVLRYWEEEFPQLNPMKRNKRRYYKHEEVEFIAQLQHLIYERKFTLKGAREHLSTQKKKSREGNEQFATQSAIFSSVSSVIKRMNLIIKKLETIANN